MYYSLEYYGADGWHLDRLNFEDLDGDGVLNDGGSCNELLSSEQNLIGAAMNG